MPVPASHLDALRAKLNDAESYAEVWEYMAKEFLEAHARHEKRITRLNLVIESLRRELREARAAQLGREA